MLRIRKLICVLLVMALLAPAALAGGVTAKINATSVRVYKSASTSSKSVTVAKGTTVTVNSVSGSWAKISKNGKTAYVNVKYLTTTTRYARYIKKSTDVYRSASTSSSKLRTLSVNTKVFVVGMEGDFYRVQNESGSVTGYVLKSAVSKSKVSVTASPSSWKSKVKKMNWSEGNGAFPRGAYATIYDIDTGISVRIKRMGGLNHADVEPVSKTDTANLLRIAGGEFSWTSHAVILMYNGQYIACGINTKPHGNQTITDNNYDGQFCLHMVGSVTHENNSVNESHQTSIRRAYNWAH